MRLAEAAVPPEMQALKEQLSELASGLTGASADLQEISRGIHPAILSKGGLGPALKTLARRSAVPVELVLGIDRRLPDSAEVAAYYVVAETLTNAAKHAQASVVNVCVDTEGASLHLSIRDDGIGGADTAKGSGLIGLIDRVEALGGTIAIASETGAGTSLHVTIPFEIE
jgi:signal transduction histidine kinase